MRRRTNQDGLQHAHEATETFPLLHQCPAHRSLLRLLQGGVALVDALQGAVQLAASLALPCDQEEDRSEVSRTRGSSVASGLRHLKASNLYCIIIYSIRFTVYILLIKIHFPDTLPPKNFKKVQNVISPLKPYECNELETYSSAIK